MTHREYLFSLEQFGIKLGLDQIRALVAALDLPHRRFRSIVIAGTNGKGSVAAMVERALRAAGLKTGRYTSPHLIAIEERVALDGASVSPAVFEEAAGRVREAAARLAAPPSFFEATTAVAFEIFRRAAVDVAVLEVGMGGRLDATNVVHRDAVAITAIDLDHQAWLGSTLAAIAAEKAGVIKPGCLVVAAPNPPEVLDVIAGAAAAAPARLVAAGDGVTAAIEMAGGATTLSLTTPRRPYAPMRLALRGRHQAVNAVTAVRLLEELHAEGRFRVPEAAIRAGLEQAVWPGRLDARRWKGRDILIDGAHNPGGARALADFVLETYAQRLPMVVGVMRDKALDDLIAALAPAAARFVFTAPASPRAASPEHLRAAAMRVAPAVPADVAHTPAEAVDLAVRLGSPAVVAGSLYLAGEVLGQIP